MGPRELWRRLLFENFAPEFGGEVAEFLASLPLRERRERIRDWYRMVVRWSPEPVLPADAVCAMIERDVAQLKMILEAHRAVLPSKVAERLGEIATQVDGRSTPTGQALDGLLKAERLLFFLPQGERRLSVLGVQGLMALKGESVRFITKKCRAQLMIDGLQGKADSLSASDRERLVQLRELHGRYSDVVERVKVVMRSEEEMVREGYSADPFALTGFRSEVAEYDVRLRGLRRG